MTEEKSKKKFYVIATPIGNLGDITFRALETLKEADLILCEDTRVTKKLLDRYNIQKPLLSYHQQSKPHKIKKIIEYLKNGKTLALATDAGTPGISDPGNKLVAEILEEFGDEIKIVPIPGASAITALASVAGIDLSKFAFLGFPPNKKGRETFFKEAINIGYPVFYYDSPHRFLKNIKLCRELMQKEKIERKIIVGRELTKMFEEIVRGDSDEIIKYFEANKRSIRGEFVVIIAM
ncbi:MAG: 16S rRNA (cytidine(1402)-2'-O)-methyltransferase [Patescibacteria group bacterium]|nr:16S rRNA (cytidine(1402)-2'-O)-methyltransferase [Patescibacteria group bacterium]